MNFSAPSNPDLGSNALGTAAFCLFMDQCFDSVNAATRNAKDGKILRSAVTSSSPHITFWNTAIEVFKSMKFLQLNKQNNIIKVSTPPCVKNWIVTLCGFKYVWSKLQKIDFKYFITRNMNQDSLECFFGSSRQHGVRNINPTCHNFMNTFKTLLLNNFPSVKSIGQNCEQDNIDCLSNLKIFLTNKSLSELNTTDIAVPINVNPPIQIYSNNSYISDMVLGYITGFILKKIFTIISECDTCKNELKSQVQTNKNIKVRQYTKKNALNQPSSFLCNLIKNILKLLNQSVDDLIYKNNVGKQLLLLIELHIDFDFSCEIHMLTIKNIIIKYSINLTMFTLCKNMNRILKGVSSPLNSNAKLNKIAVDFYNKHSRRFKPKLHKS